MYNKPCQTCKCRVQLYIPCSDLPPPFFLKPPLLRTIGMQKWRPPVPLEGHFGRTTLSPSGTCDGKEPLPQRARVGVGTLRASSSGSRALDLLVLNNMHLTVPVSSGFPVLKKYENHKNPVSPYKSASLGTLLQEWLMIEKCL